MTSEETKYLASRKEGPLCKRSKRLTNKSDRSTHEWEPDSNGCTHDDIKTFQREEDHRYWDPAYSTKYYKTEEDQLDTACLWCGKNILDAMQS